MKITQPFFPNAVFHNWKNYVCSYLSKLQQKISILVLSIFNAILLYYPCFARRKINPSKQKTIQTDQKIENAKGELKKYINIFLNATCKMDKNEEILAFQLFQRFANAGDAEAMHYLGICYKDAIGVEKNPIKAFEMFKQSAENGYLISKNQLGLCYQEGFGVKSNMMLSFECFKEAAEEGFICAMCNVGVCYKLGSGTEVNKNLAREYFRKAVEKGSAVGLFLLGAEYIENTVASAPNDYGYELILRSAILGDINAIEMIGQCYYLGYFLEKDLKNSYRCYHIVAKGGLESAKDWLNEFEKNH